MRDFRRLNVWVKAHQLVLEVYQATKRFPGNERYGLTNQFQRAVASIPTNIAEGCGRQGDKEFARFLQIACSSASETEYPLLLSHDLNYPDPISFQKLNIQIVEIRCLLTGLIQKLKADR
jgi:four helix bundle protein